MPLKDQYTLIELSNTLIEQSDLLAMETRISIIIGNARVKKNNGVGNSGRNSR